MIVVNNAVQDFSYDARCHNEDSKVDQSDKQQVCHKCNCEMSGGVSSIKVCTRCFYNSAVDKKQVQGLLAQGRKTFLVTGYLKPSVAVNSQIRVTQFNPNTSVVSDVSHPTSLNSVQSSDHASVTGVLDGFHTPHNATPTSIVRVNNFTRTFGYSNGGLINESVTNCDNKGVKAHTQSFNDAMCHKSQVVGHSQNGNLWSGKAKVLHLIDESIHESANAIVDQNTSVQNNNGHPPCNESQDQYALIYDINMGQNDFGTELCNTLFFKNGWKKHEQYLRNNCADFNLWRTQTDHHFGFVPLSNIVLPNNPDHIGEKVDHPIQQHLATGIPNFWGTRIPVKSQLNVKEWKRILVNYQLVWLSP